jgi:hypothetical protein
MKAIAIVLLLAASAWAVTPCDNPNHTHKLTVSKFANYEVKPCDNPNHHHKLTVSSVGPVRSPFKKVKPARRVTESDGSVMVYNPYCVLPSIYPPRPVLRFNNSDKAQTLYNPYSKLPPIQEKD